MQVMSSHIQVTVICEECGFEDDVEYYDTEHVDTAIDNAAEMECPHCVREMENS